MNFNNRNNKFWKNRITNSFQNFLIIYLKTIQSILYIMKPMTN